MSNKGNISDKIFLIGNKDDYKEFELNKLNIDTLPVANLPVSYFPFFYNDNESSIEKMKRLVPLFENAMNINVADDKNAKVASYTIDTDKLFSLLTNLEESYQPFNNNNIYHIQMFVIFVWIIMLFVVLKICRVIFGRYYTYFIIFMIMMLLIMSTLWAIIITGKNF